MKWKWSKYVWWPVPVWHQQYDHVVAQIGPLNRQCLLFSVKWANLRKQINLNLSTPNKPHWVFLKIITQDQCLKPGNCIHMTLRPEKATLFFKTLLRNAYFSCNRVNYQVSQNNNSSTIINPIHNIFFKWNFPTIDKVYINAAPHE